MSQAEPQSDSPTTEPMQQNSRPSGERAAVFLVVVDNSPEMHVALRWASLRARRSSSEGHRGDRRSPQVNLDAVARGGFQVSAEFLPLAAILCKSLSR